MQRFIVTGRGAADVVEGRRGPDDVVLDLDQLHAVVGPSSAARAVALAMLDAGRRRAERLHEHATVWLIHPDATLAQLRAYTGHGYVHAHAGAPPGRHGRGGPRVRGTAAKVGGSAGNRIDGPIMASTADLSANGPSSTVWGRDG